MCLGPRFISKNSLHYRSGVATIIAASDAQIQMSDPLDVEFFESFVVIRQHSTGGTVTHVVAKERLIVLSGTE